MQQSTENRARNLAIYPGKMPSIEYAYFKVTTMFANIGLKKRHMRVSSSSIDFLSKQPPIAIDAVGSTIDITQ